ncbi:MAG: DUF3892 domain-containing protein [Oscillospiraceae bacterium]
MINRKSFGNVLNTLEGIPTPNPDAKQIVALVREKGVVSGYKLSDGQILSKADGVAMAKQGEIKGVGIASRQGTEYLKSIPDGNEAANLSHLPTI